MTAEKYQGDGSPFSTPDPTIKEFRERFDNYASDITVDGDFIMSHKIKSSVQVRCINSDKSYRLVGMTIGQLMGCGCWADIILEIEEE